jgi:FAD/FMN-containing dehydrogenase
VLLESEEIEVGRWLADLGKWVEECGEGVLDTRIFETKSMGAQAWSLREEVPESILSGGEVHQQDISVALARLTSLEEALREVFRPLGETTCQAFLFGHIGDGNLHVFLERKESVSTEAFRAECSRLDQTLFRIVSSLQGSVSAEHGLGLLKLEAYERFSGSPSHELELRLKRDLKRLFDPTGILNPGKVVSL